MKVVKDKIRFALWLKPETMEKVRAASAQDDCGSLSEFIEKAVLAYLGYLSAGQLQKTIFLPRRNSADPLTPAPVHRERGRGSTHWKAYGWGNMNHL